jgi:hypothetical protein
MEEMKNTGREISSKMMEISVENASQKVDCKLDMTFKAFSPFPSQHRKYSSGISPNLRRWFNFSAKRRRKASQFNVPGVAADAKELISPFSLRSQDYSSLYSNFITYNQFPVCFPSIRPLNSTFKGSKILTKTSKPMNPKVLARKPLNSTALC